MAGPEKNFPQKDKILVTGANGQLGKELKRLEPSCPQFDFVFLSREDLPIHHFEMIRHYFKAYHPKWVINCAAYTAVDRAEQEKEMAFQVNGEAVGVLSAICKENNTRLIHLSTDYVFNGKANAPYAEDAPTDPASVYGASKLEGEKQALHFNPDTIIIRTSWLYSEYGINFVKTMIKLMEERESINVVNDQWGSPTYAADLAAAILVILSSGKWIPGIYHFSNEGIISWYDFALAIRQLANSKCRVNPVSSSEYPSVVSRPRYSALSTQKITRVYGILPPNWQDSLSHFFQRITRTGK